jgi:hypothetical protein
MVAGFFAPLSKASLPSTKVVTKLISFSVGQGLVGCFIAGHSAPVICRSKQEECQLDIDHGI